MKRFTTHPSRSLRRTLPPLVAVAVLAAACSGGDAGGDADAGGGTGGGGAEEQEVVSLRFMWWGSEERAAITEEAITAFEAEHPEIDIVPEPNPFDGYFDKLATSMAADDAPDIFTLGGAYPLEYASRGGLLNLNDVEQLDTSQFDQPILANAEYEGGLYGVPTGANTVAMFANPELFEQAGVEMPDDDTWTWQDLADISAEISANTPENVVGFEPRFHDFDRIWFAQRGQPMYTEDGTLDVEAETLAEYWELGLEMQESGAIPEPSLLNEVINAETEQTLVAQNQAALHTNYSNLLETLSVAADADLQLLRFPSEDQYERPGMTLLPSQYFSIWSGTDHPEEAATFVDFLVNSTEAGQILGTDRGMPSNSDVREAISDQLNEYQQAEADFIDRIAEVAGEGLPPQPEGASIHNDLTQRMESDVYFGRKTPQEAAEQWIAELTQALGE